MHVPTYNILYLQSNCKLVCVWESNQSWGWIPFQILFSTFKTDLFWRTNFVFVLGIFENHKQHAHSPVWSSILLLAMSKQYVQSTITTTLLNALRVEPVWHFLTLNWARASSVGWMVAGWLFQPWVCKVQQHQHEALGWWVVTKMKNCKQTADDCKQIADFSILFTYMDAWKDKLSLVVPKLHT